MGCRSNKAERCPFCRMHTELCICLRTPTLNLPTRLILVMHNRLPGIQHAELVTLPSGPTSEWKIRKAAQSHQLSTCEAIARAYGILESTHAQTQLETIFRLMVERTLETRKMSKGHREKQV